MRTAVISDIHANLPALEAVLAAAGDAGADRIWCLGDVVGYGAHPRECLDLALDRCEVCLQGNHDLAAVGELDIDVFSPGAARAAVWTFRALGAEGRELLGALDGSSAERDGIGLFHASPRDPVWEYVVDSQVAADNLAFQTGRISLIGHSHIALFFTRPDSAGPVQAALAPAGTVCRLDEGEWLLNPGSVGQPRDGTPEAAWILMDTDDLTVEYHRTPYPVDVAANAIRAAGLPPDLADRLYLGR